MEPHIRRRRRCPRWSALEMDRGPSVRKEASRRCELSAQLQIMPMQKDTLRTKSVWVNIYILSGEVKCILAGIGVWKIFSFKKLNPLLNHCISPFYYSRVLFINGFIFFKRVTCWYLFPFFNLLVR